jgi:hypothetical protein
MNEPISRLSQAALARIRFRNNLLPACAKRWTYSVIFLSTIFFHVGVANAAAVDGIRLVSGTIDTSRPAIIRLH